MAGCVSRPPHDGTAIDCASHMLLQAGSALMAACDKVYIIPLPHTNPLAARAVILVQCPSVFPHMEGTPDGGQGMFAGRVLEVIADPTIADHVAIGTQLLDHAVHPRNSLGVVAFGKWSHRSKMATRHSQFVLPSPAWPSKASRFLYLSKDPAHLSPPAAM